MNAARVAEQIKKALGAEALEAWVRGLVETAGEVRPGGELAFFCPAHEHGHRSPSAAINVETGLWNCLNPACAARGDAIELFRIVRGLPSPGEAIRVLAVELGVTPTVPQEQVAALHAALVGDPERIALARKALGIGPETLRRYQIGWSAEQGRFVFPVLGDSGHYEDLRLYQRDGHPKILSLRGHGGARPFPLEETRRPTLYLFEGEKDALRALDLGIVGAFTFTASPKGLSAEDFSFLEGKNVFLCYDVDQAGKIAGEEISRIVAEFAAVVAVVEIPPEGLPPNGDFSDWVDAGGDLVRWGHLCATARRVPTPTLTPRRKGRQNADLPRRVSFADLTAGRLYGIAVEVAANVVGQGTDESYQFPTEVGISCDKDQPCCEECPFNTRISTEQPWRVEIDPSREASLELIRVTDAQRNASLRMFLGIPKKCKGAKIRDLKRTTLQEMILTPQIEEAGGTLRRDGEPSAFVRAFCVGPTLAPNTSYRFTGHVQADPRNQRTILNAHTITPTKTSLDRFQFDEKTVDAIQRFRPQEGMCVGDHVRNLVRRVGDHLRVFGQDTLCRVVMMTHLSALEFSVGLYPVRMGVVEGLVIGNPATGKSTVVQRYLDLVGLGRWVSGEQTSLAGLLGGVSEVDRIRIVRWGIMVACHRGYLCIDEMDALLVRENVLGQISSVRSSGVAQVAKIASDETPCKVRMNHLTNTVGGVPIETIGGAVYAIPGLFQAQQDVNRYTLACGVVSDGVSVKRMTSQTPSSADPLLGLLGTLTLLVWSLPQEQIRFTPAAIDVLQERAEALIRKYHRGIPLIEEGRTFEKIARLSAPIAAMCGNFEVTDGLPHLVIDRAHADYAVTQLEEIYDGHTMGYLAYSQAYKPIGTFPRADVHQTIADLQPDRRAYPNLVRILQQATTLNKDLVAQLATDWQAGNRIWAALIALGCIRAPGRRGQDWVKTQEFCQFLQEEMTWVHAGCPNREERRA